MNDEYLIGLEPNLVKLLSLAQDYKVATKECKTAIRDLQRQKRRALSKKNEKLDEDNKKLERLLESIHRFRTQPEKRDPPIDLSNGKVLVSIEDPMAW
jgi:hypothetical protein